MKREQEEYPLHVAVSNQSLYQTTADLLVSLDGIQIFRREMRTGTQHIWEEITIPVVRGQHTILISEARTNSEEELTVNIDHDMWIVITFHSPPDQIRAEILDQPVGLI